MILQRTPKPWTCLAASFASALEIPYDLLIQRIGHDGSEIMHPTFPDPYCRRAFHIQEMIDVALEDGWLVTPIDAIPTYALHGRVTQGQFKMEKDPGLRMLKYLSEGFGILTGENMRGRPHAVVWDRSQVHDPATMTSYSIQHFSIQTFWKLTRADQH